MEKFEYQVLEFGRSNFISMVIKDIQPTLNKLGADGWEVVSTVTVSRHEGATHLIVFTLKRKII